MTNTKFKIDDHSEVVNMCEAIQGLINDGIAEGIVKGEANAWLYVDKEVYRARRESIKALGENSVLHIFDSALKNPTATVLVLKKPKTDSSIRKIWIPKTVAYILRH